MQYELPGGKSLLRGGTRVKKPVRSLVSRPTPTVQRFVGRPTPKMSLSKKSKNSSNNALPPAVKAILKSMPEELELIPLPPDTPKVKYVIFGRELYVPCTFNVHPTQLALQQAAAYMNPYDNMDIRPHFDELVEMLGKFTNSGVTQIRVKDLIGYPDGVNPKRALDPQKPEDFAAIFGRLKHNAVVIKRNVRTNFERTTGSAQPQREALIVVYNTMLAALDKKISKSIGERQNFFRAMKGHLLKEDVAPKSFFDKTCYICGARAYKIEGEIKEIIKILGSFQEEVEHLTAYGPAVLQGLIPFTSAFIDDIQLFRDRIVRLTLCLGELKSSCANCNGKKTNDNILGTVILGGASIPFPDVTATVTLLDDCFLNPRMGALRSAELWFEHGHRKSVEIRINGTVMQLSAEMFTFDQAVLEAQRGGSEAYKTLEARAEIFMKEVYRQINLELINGRAGSPDSHHAALFNAYSSFITSRLPSLLRTELNTCMWQQLLFTTPRGDRSLSILLSTGSAFAGGITDRVKQRFSQKRATTAFEANTAVSNAEGEEGARSYINRIMESATEISPEIFAEIVRNYYAEGAAFMTRNYNSAFFTITPTFRQELNGMNARTRPAVLARIITPASSYTIGAVIKAIQMKGGQDQLGRGFTDADNKNRISNLLTEEVRASTAARAAETGAAASSSAAAAAPVTKAEVRAAIVPTTVLVDKLLQIPPPSNGRGAAAAAADEPNAGDAAAASALPPPGYLSSAPSAAAAAPPLSVVSFPPSFLGFGPPGAAASIIFSSKLRTPVPPPSFGAAAAAPPSAAPSAAAAAAASSSALSRTPSMVEGATALRSIMGPGGRLREVPEEESVSMSGITGTKRGGRRARTMRKKLKRGTRRRHHKRTRRN